jgi:hypothetical protein
MAERAEPDRNRDSGDLVVDDLVPDQDLKREGAVRAIEVQRDDRLLRRLVRRK